MDFSSKAAGLDMSRILANPLLQSTYSEELRLRNGVIIQRVPAVDTSTIGPWKFSKGKKKSSHLLVTEKRDRSVWNEGPVNGVLLHSVEDFWAERFIVYPNEPNSGPRKHGRNSKPRAKTVSEEVGSPKFSTDSVTGAYIHFGGGLNICPGRSYAGQEVIGAFAMFLAMFDIELEEKNLPQPNLAFFPLGVVPPKGKCPVKIRRQKA